MILFRVYLTSWLQVRSLICEQMYDCSEILYVYIKIVNESLMAKYLNVASNINVGSITVWYFISIWHILGPIGNISKSGADFLKSF
jgi:hypothetical protein